MSGPGDIPDLTKCSCYAFLILISFTICSFSLFFARACACALSSSLVSRRFKWSLASLVYSAFASLKALLHSYVVVGMAKCRSSSIMRVLIAGRTSILFWRPHSARYKKLRRSRACVSFRDHHKLTRLRHCFSPCWHA